MEYASGQAIITTTDHPMPCIISNNDINPIKIDAFFIIEIAASLVLTIFKISIIKRFNI